MLAGDAFACAAEHLAVSNGETLLLRSGGVDIVFASDTPQDYVDLIDDAVHPSTSDQNPGLSSPFTLTSRWSSTATDGFGLGQGDPTTVTWSIAADGTPIPALGGIAGESQDPSDFISFMGGIYGVTTDDSNYVDEPWFSVIQSAFDRWSELSGLTFVYEPNDDGAAFSSSSFTAPGILGTRGDVRIGGHNIDGNSGVLAYNFFPNNGEMVVDTADNFYDSLSNNSIRLRNVMAHEQGHGIGLRHVESNNAKFLMEPFINTSFDGPQFDDILGAQRHYGDFNESSLNDSTANATDLGIIADKQTVTVGSDVATTVVDFAATDFVSIDDDSDVDVFQFEIGSVAEIDLLLTPVGPTYNQSPQDESQTSFDAASQSDLTVELIDTDGSTILTTANANGIGQIESVLDFELSAAGQYFARISGADNTVQLYRLEIMVDHNLHDPIFTSPAAFDVDENTLAVGTVTATDADLPAQTVSYQITGGADQSAFSIDSGSGELAFNSIPNFELPMDVGTDNVYEIEVTADDGNSGITVQSINVTIADVIETANFTLTQADDNVDENTAYTSEFPILAGDDPIGSLTYSLSGADQALLTVDEATGVVSMMARDFESPADANSDNVYEVTLDAIDDDGNTSAVSFTVTVDNIAPTASIAGPSTGVPFQGRTLTLTATDPSPTGQTPDFTFDIDWDGDDVVDQTIVGPSGTQVTHHYEALGANTIKVTASDQGAAVSGVVTHAINIVRVELQGADLVWGGTSGEDAVEFEETAAQTVEVRANLLDGVVVSDTQTFVGVSGQVIAFGGDDADVIDAGGVDGLVNISAMLIGGLGDDTITGGEAADTIRGDAEGDGSEGRDVIDGGGGDDLIYGDGMEGAADTIMGGDGNDTIYGDNGDISADGAEGNDVIYGDDGDDTLFGGRKNDTIFGGNGNDIIDGQTGHDILSGGAGDDTLSGGEGKDLLFAGVGADTLHGNSGDDLLVAGATSFDFIEADLKLIRNEWWSAGSYATRVANISGTPGGANDPVFLQPGVNVFDDGEVDTLFGEGEMDWFLYSQTGLIPDILSDLEAGELETDIAP
jgi:Ca2+-binding RTX toxin-like protein